MRRFLQAARIHQPIKLSKQDFLVLAAPLRCGPTRISLRRATIFCMLTRAWGISSAAIARMSTVLNDHRLMKRLEKYRPSTSFKICDSPHTGRV
jgi:hypothetical protein